jgi:hypothetical protein
MSFRNTFTSLSINGWQGAGGSGTGPYVQAQTLASPTANPFDDFGWSISMDDSGTYLVVGARRDTLSPANGAAYIFQRNGATWTQTQKLTGGLAANNASFGSSVAISGNGNYIVIGADNDIYDVGYGNARGGSAYVYSYNSGSYSFQQRLNSGYPIGINIIRFGSSVALNYDGSHLAIGATGGSPPGPTTGGGAFAFTRTGSTWTLDQALIAPPSSVSGSQVGSSICIDGPGNKIIVGAQSANVSATRSGAAYLYSRSGTSWGLAQTFTGATANTYLGASTSISNNASILAVATYFGGTNYIYTGPAYSLSQTLLGGGQKSNISASGTSLVGGFENSGIGNVNTSGANLVFEYQQTLRPIGASNSTAVTSTTSSADGQWLALSAAGNGALAGQVYIYTNT